MEKRYYTVDSLRKELREYEQRYGISTAEAVAAYRTAARSAEGVDNFDLFVWVQTACEVERLAA